MRSVVYAPIPIHGLLCPYSLLNIVAVINAVAVCPDGKECLSEPSRRPTFIVRFSVFTTPPLREQKKHPTQAFYPRNYDFVFRPLSYQALRQLEYIAYNHPDDNQIGADSRCAPPGNNRFRFSQSSLQQPRVCQYMSPDRNVKMKTYRAFDQSFLPTGVPLHSPANKGKIQNVHANNRISFFICHTFF